MLLSLECARAFARLLSLSLECARAFARLLSLSLECARAFAALCCTSWAWNVLEQHFAAQVGPGMV